MTIPNLFYYALTINGVLLAILFIVGLFVLFFEKRHARKREERFLGFLNSPSSLRWVSPQMQRPSVFIPSMPQRSSAPDAETDIDSSQYSEAISEVVDSSSQLSASSLAQTLSPQDDSFHEEESLASDIFSESQDEEPAETKESFDLSADAQDLQSGVLTDVTMDLGYSDEDNIFDDKDSSSNQKNIESSSDLELSDESTSQSVAQKPVLKADETLAFEMTFPADLLEQTPSPQEEPPQEEPPQAEPPQEEESPADQVLYLDPDFELSEIKRILRVWSMIPEGDLETKWSAEDGTKIQLKEAGDKGLPFLEIRGPMAEDLALYLPQDLPVHPLSFGE